MSTDDASVITRLVVQFSDYLDLKYDADHPDWSADHRLMMRTTNKLGEELGEVAGAIGGMLAENPRKGRTHGPTDVVTELMDVAGCALGAAVHVCRREGFHPDVMTLLLNRLLYVTQRAGLPTEPSRKPR